MVIFHSYVSLPEGNHDSQKHPWLFWLSQRPDPGPALALPCPGPGPACGAFISPREAAWTVKALALWAGSCWEIMGNSWDSNTLYESYDDIVNYSGNIDTDGYWWIIPSPNAKHPHSMVSNICKSPTSTMVSGQKNYLFRGTDEWSPNCSYFRRASRKSLGLPSSATWQWIDGMMSEVTIQWLQPKTPHMAIGTNSFPVSHGDPVCSVRIYTYTEDTYSMCCIHIYYIYIHWINYIYMKECIYSLNLLYIYTYINSMSCLQNHAGL